MRGFVIAMAAVMLCAVSVQAGWRRGLVLNGSSEYITAPQNNSLIITGDVSVSCWINASSIASAERIISHGVVADETEAGNILYDVFFNTTSGNDLSYIHEYGNGDNQILTFDANLNVGEWYHVVMVRDVSLKSVSMYLNGTIIDSSQTYSSDPTGGGSGTLTIGSLASVNLFAGTIAAPMIWNRALSSAEMAGLYNETVAITNDGTNVELPRRWISGTDSVVLDLDVGEEWDSGDTVTNGTLMVNNGSAGGTATVVGTPDVSGAAKVPPTNR